jgi:hypothetical protein
MRSNQRSASGLVSHTPTSSGTTGWSSSALQRPMAAGQLAAHEAAPTMPTRTRSAVTLVSVDGRRSARTMAPGSGCWMTLRP